jgi:hypothetical protein
MRYCCLLASRRLHEVGYVPGDAGGTGNVCIVWITKQTPTYGISQVVCRSEALVSVRGREHGSRERGMPLTQSELQIRLLCGRVNVSAP